MSETPEEAARQIVEQARNQNEGVLIELITAALAEQDNQIALAEQDNQIALADIGNLLAEIDELKFERDAAYATSLDLEKQSITAFVCGLERAKKLAGPVSGGFDQAIQAEIERVTCRLDQVRVKL